MQNFEFRLTPAYCLYNGVAVQEQMGSYIRFITEDINNITLKESLEKAFRNYLSEILKRKDCGKEYLNLPEIEFTAGSHEEVRNEISKLYREEYNEKTDASENADKIKSEAAAIVLLDSILDEALRSKATDIHIENNSIRFRINGQLKEYGQIQKDRIEELVLRIKLLGGMNVLEKRKSQDGRFVFRNKNPVFIRVSTMGIVGESFEDGEESVVLRLLDTSRLPLGISSLGFSEKQVGVLETLASYKNGLILICGPTGSGKSTTAASMLMEIVKKQGASKKIISLEEPPEYRIPGVTQMKIDSASANTYEKALECIFRQDPDVIMIGEIRSAEGAQAALRASMTGHLVFATLHTDSIASTILRLENLGCSREILGTVLRAVILQELENDEESVNLAADISVSKPVLGKMIKESIDTERIEQAFMHFTNVRSVLGRIDFERRFMNSGMNIRTVSGVNAV